MSISFIGLVCHDHSIRYKYLKTLFSEIKSDNDELILVNRVSDYRLLENIEPSSDRWFKSIDLLNVDDDFKSQMAGISRINNDFICILNPYGYYTKDGISKLLNAVSKGDYSAAIFNSCIRINPQNGHYYRMMSRANVSMGSMIFSKKYLDGFINTTGVLTTSLYSNISATGQMCLITNAYDYMEFLEYDSDDISKSVTDISIKPEPKSKKPVQKALAYLRHSIIN